MEKKEELQQESLEEQVEEIRKEMFKFMEFFLPPREVRQEILKNLQTMELSFWRIIKTLVDYEVSRLEQKLEKKEKGGKEKIKKIEVE